MDTSFPEKNSKLNFPQQQHCEYEVTPALPILIFSQARQSGHVSEDNLI